MLVIAVSAVVGTVQVVCVGSYTVVPFTIRNCDIVPLKYPEAPLPPTQADPTLKMSLVVGCAYVGVVVLSLMPFINIAVVVPLWDIAI